MRKRALILIITMLSAGAIAVGCGSTSSTTTSTPTSHPIQIEQTTSKTSAKIRYDQIRGEAIGYLSAWQTDFSQPGVLDSQEQVANVSEKYAPKLESTGQELIRLAVDYPPAGTDLRQLGGALIAVAGDLNQVREVDWTSIGDWGTKVRTDMDSFAASATAVNAHFGITMESTY